MAANKLLPKPAAVASPAPAATAGTSGKVYPMGRAEGLLLELCLLLHLLVAIMGNALLLLQHSF